MDLLRGDFWLLYPTYCSYACFVFIADRQFSLIHGSIFSNWAANLHSLISISIPSSQLCYSLNNSLTYLFFELNLTSSVECDSVEWQARDFRWSWLIGEALAN